jgi:hypothetical protein
MATRKPSISKTKSKRGARAEADATLAVASPETIAHAENSNGTVQPVPTLEQIRFRAYEMFLARGGAHGDDWKDWFAAERELRGSPRPS